MTDQQADFFDTSIINLILVGILSVIGFMYFGLIAAATATACGQVFLNVESWFGSFEQFRAVS